MSMSDSRKSGRLRKPVNYSKFAEVCSDENDDDFRDCTPPAKKTKIIETSKEKGKVMNTESESKKVQKKPSKERPSLDDRKFQKEMEAALELSKQTSQSADSSREHTNENSSDGSTSIKPTARCKDSDFESGDEKKDGKSIANQKSASTKKDEDFCPDDEDSDAKSDSSDDDFAASDADSDYEENKRKPGPKCSKTKKTAPVTSTNVSPASTSLPKTPTISSSVPKSRTPAASTIKAVPRTPLGVSACVNKPSWTPPARVSTPTNKSIAVKSPGSGLRLGLSRSQRVKSLHSNVKVS